MKLKVAVRVISGALLLMGFLSSCSAPTVTQRADLPLPTAGNISTAYSPLTTGVSSEESNDNKERTGIATGWGKEIESPIGYTDFKRAMAKPKYVSLIRYNDSDGAREMGVDRRMSGGGMQKTAGGMLEWGLHSGWSMLDNYWWRGARFVIGKKGRDYRLRVKNLSDARLEVVLTVDGLDVIDGKAGSTKKRGYIIGAGEILEVKGFRISHGKVATFRFSSVNSSYANLRHGRTRNVGVVGLALFTEKGKEPGAEIRARQGARPFAEAPMIRARD
ncbi:MAG TPA: hypothetical protein DDY45_01150 [Verrucomicrobiales bacterium]|jgi:hypothetical protein|nr:hypothetical protein [Verrucomicrobiales bacterium]